MKVEQKELIRSLLFFDAMLMPKIINFIYWLLLLVVLVGGIGMLLNGKVLSAIGIWVFGAVFVRLWCELMIVLFKINSNLQKIADKK